MPRSAISKGSSFKIQLFRPTQSDYDEQVFLGPTSTGNDVPLISLLAATASLYSSARHHHITLPIYIPSKSSPFPALRALTPLLYIVLSSIAFQSTSLCTHSHKHNPHISRSKFLSIQGKPRNKLIHLLYSPSTYTLQCLIAVLNIAFYHLSTIIHNCANLYSSRLYPSSVY